MDRFLEGVEFAARKRCGSEHRHHDGDHHLADNLDALSALAGFKPGSGDTWNSLPTCTLRFAEVLTKIRASHFRVGEVLYLFNAAHPQHAEDPFPLQDDEDALNHPLDLLDDDEHHSLGKLREALLAVHVSEEEACAWTWPRVVAAMRDHFGYAPVSGTDPLLSLGQHFFPGVLEAAGFSVSVKQRQYRVGYSDAGAAATWNAPPGSPFQFDTTTNELVTELPLTDKAVIAKLSQIPTLPSSGQFAVRNLYFAPRLDLTLVAFLFPDWPAAERQLIEESVEAERWAYFRRHFALASARRQVIVDHLARHVAHRVGCRHEELEGAVGVILRHLYADENNAKDWENPDGTPPSVMWKPPPSGGALAALLGLAGTGLLGEFRPPLSSDPKAAPGAVFSREAAQSHDRVRLRA